MEAQVKNVLGEGGTASPKSIESFAARANRRKYLLLRPWRDECGGYQGARLARANSTSKGSPITPQLCG